VRWSEADDSIIEWNGDGETGEGGGFLGTIAGADLRIEQRGSQQLPQTKRVSRTPWAAPVIRWFDDWGTPWAVGGGAWEGEGVPEEAAVALKVLRAP